MALINYIKERGTVIQGSEDSPPGFCKVFVPKYLEGDVKDLPEAWIQGAVGNRQNEGSMPTVQKGDYVWVEMHQSEAKPATLKVIVVGSAYSAPGGLPNIPHDGYDGPLTLYKKHQIPRDSEGNIHEDFEEPKRYVKGRSIPIIVQEGISWVIQNGQSILTHLKTFSHFLFLESGTIDLSSSNNLFLRAKKNLHIWANKISFKGKTIEFSLDDLILELKKFDINAEQISLESGGLAKIIAAAIQLTTTGDFVLSAGGKISQDASGSALTNVNQDLLAETTKAWGAKLLSSGAPIADMGIEALMGKIIAENMQGSVRGQLDEIIDKINELIDGIGDAVIKTGTGDGVISPKTKSDLMKIKAANAKIKALNSLIMK